MTQNTNANDTYKARKLEAHGLIQAIQIGLDFHGARQRRDEESWEHAGDLAHVNEKLKEIADFLGVKPRR